VDGDGVVVVVGDVGARSEARLRGWSVHIALAVVVFARGDAVSSVVTSDSEIED
jgi:hypothetical protein